MEKIDLHIHTNLSDGNHDINEIISLAKKQECSTIAITDHEIIKDYSKIALDNKINIINGIEFNTSEKGMHILAYGITNINEINKCMNELHSENEDASLKLIDLLQKKNINISLESVDEYLNSIGLKYTYLDKRHIVKYLISKGITKDVYDTYKNLIGRGTDLYIPLKKITSSEIISKIDKCGGISVLAHPFTLNQNDDELESSIKKLKYYGLDGIEVVNGNILNDLIKKYELLADNYELIRTVGSDFHNIKNSTIGINYCEDYDIIDKMNEKIYQKIKRR